MPNLALAIKEESIYGYWRSDQKLDSAPELILGIVQRGPKFDARLCLWRWLAASYSCANVSRKYRKTKAISAPVSAGFPPLGGMAIGDPGLW